MKYVTIQEFSLHPSTYISSANAEQLFIYPTDTIYGIGAIVTSETIEKIDNAKQRLSGKHYSIIAPSFERIYAHFHVHKHIENDRDDRSRKFPGRGLTMLLPYINKASHLAGLSANNLLGVRYLGNHPLQTFVTQLGQPFITSSCNISGTEPITRTQELPHALLEHVDVIIDGGELNGKPSVVIDYVSGEIIRG